MIRSALRRTYELDIASVFRGLHLRQLKNLETRKTLAIAKENGFATLTLASLQSLAEKKSSTCFILGSGSSINDLTEENLETIKRGFSIGINAWVSHGFTPDAYSFEADGLDEDPSQEIQTMTKALAEKAREKPDLALLLLRPKRADLQKRMVEIPPSLRQSSFMCGRYNLTTRRHQNLEKDLDKILSREKKRPLRVPVVVENGATVARLLTLSALAGFTKVVLVGVDLNSSGYFWQETNATPLSAQWIENYPRKNLDRHDTLETDKRPFSNLDFLTTLAPLLQKHFEVETFIGSHKSSLASRLPVYDWEG